MSEVIDANLNDPECPSRKMLDLLGNKWSLRVMYDMLEGPRRYNQLQRNVDGISYKMLTQTLRQLEDANLVHREEHNVMPPHVEYTLTPLGVGLLQEAMRLVHWGFAHANELGWAR